MSHNYVFTKYIEGYKFIKSQKKINHYKNKDDI